MKNCFVPLLFVILSSTAVGATEASPCTQRSAPPVGAAFEQADLGVIVDACPKSEIGLGLGARAIIESENFYGNLRGALRLDASIVPLPRLEVFLSTEPFFYQQVIQSFKASALTYGDTSVGGKLLLLAQHHIALSALARVDLPTSFGYYRHAFPVGIEGGVLARVSPHEVLRFHGGLLGASTFAVTNADPDPRGAIIANGGVEVVPLDWLAFVMDLDAQMLERADLDRLALGVGVRFHVHPVVVDVGAAIPFAGAERNLASLLVRVAVPIDVVTDLLSMSSPISSE